MNWIFSVLVLTFPVKADVYHLSQRVEDADGWRQIRCSGKGEEKGILNERGPFFLGDSGEQFRRHCDRTAARQRSSLDISQGLFEGRR